MNKTRRLPARVFGVVALVLSGWLPASPLLAAPAVQVVFSPEGSAKQLILSVIGEAQRDMSEVAKEYLAHWQSRWAQGQDWQSTY
ncbi:hypothetical protein SME05J_48350 (plasmid) [Serratia marcescens]|nr:hypothetical protein SME05J_48350 [Serratia marcescens]